MLAWGRSSVGGYSRTTRERHANRDARARDPNRGDRLLTCFLASRFACHSKRRPCSQANKKLACFWAKKKAAWNYFKLCTLWLQEVLISSELAQPAQLEGFNAHGCLMGPQLFGHARKDSQVVLQSHFWVLKMVMSQGLQTRVST